MHWLNHVFFGVMIAIGVTAFVLLLRAKQARAWIWLAVAVLGAAGLAGVLAGRATGEWRTLASAGMFCLFASDHVAQYAQSRRSGAPKKVHIGLALGWLSLGVLQAIDFG